MKMPRQKEVKEVLTISTLIVDVVMLAELLFLKMLGFPIRNEVILALFFLFAFCFIIVMTDSYEL